MALLHTKGVAFLAEKAEPPGTQNWKVWIDRLRSATYSVFLPGPESWDSPFWLWAAGYACGAHEKSYLHSLDNVQEVFHDFHFLRCETFEDLAQSLLEDERHWEQRQRQRAAEAELILRNREISLTGAIISIHENIIDDFRLYLQYGISVNSTDRYGVGLIHHAARSGKKDIVQLLLEKGADPNLVAQDRGNTALMDAAAIGEAEIVELLLQHGCDLEVVSKNGQTALILAVGAKSTPCVKLLCRYGADPTRADKLGLDARGYARVLGLGEISDILETYDPVSNPVKDSSENSSANGPPGNQKPGKN